MTRWPGRRTPYTSRGIRRVPCARCGKPSLHQWQICATGNRWMGVCEECDLDLNRMTLEFFRIHDAERLLAEYIASR